MRFALTFLTLISIQASAVDLSALDWLEGKWQNNDGVSFQFTSGAGGKILGMSKFLKGNAIDFFEFIQIEQRADQVIMKVSPYGQTSPVEFTGTEAIRNDGAGVTFGNPANEFPRYITYFQRNDGTLSLRVSGIQKGTPINFETDLSRVKNAGQIFMRTQLPRVRACVPARVKCAGTSCVCCYTGVPVSLGEVCR